MKTFESELNDLWGWFKAETERLFSEYSPDSQDYGLDGSFNIEQRRQAQEWNRKLAELKAKYGVD